MADVFLSYSHKDRDQARQIVDRLKDAGCSVFWDRRLEGGDQWPDVIDEQLQSAGLVVVLWSKKSIGSRWVREEARRALDLGILTPALIDDVDPPFGFGEIQAYNLVEAEPGNSQIEALTGKVVRQAGAAGRASALLRRAFRLRSQGNFEGATEEVAYALGEFYDLLDDKHRRTYDQTAGYREETIEELEVVAGDTFDGQVRETLSGLALLPIVDAVLEVPTKSVQAMLAACCELEKDLKKKENVRVGAVIRPGSGIDSELLISQLLKETGHRGGALDLHCFLVVMNTDDPAPGASFTEMAKRRKLLAQCINWRPADGQKALADRLKCTVHRLCAATVDHELPCP